MPRFLRLLPLLLSLPGLVAAGEGPSRRFSTPAVAGVQAVAGTGLGFAAGFATFATVVAASGCAFGEEENIDEEEDYSSTSDCMGPVFLGALAGGLGYLAGTGLGVHYAGKAMGRDGGVAAAFMGACLGGFLGGLLGAKAPEHYMGPVALLVGSQLGAVGMYHLAERVRPTAAWSSAPPQPGTPSVAASLRDFRPGVEVTLGRF